MSTLNMHELFWMKLRANRATCHYSFGCCAQSLGFFDKNFGMLSTYELLKNYSGSILYMGQRKCSRSNTVRDCTTGCVRWHTRGAIRCNYKYTPGSALDMLEKAAKEWKEIDKEDCPHVGP
ncbi:hypothetical protein QOT17_009064 [Balamuthia mandrillaris]